ncbi:MAG: S8 family serine peptidase, partial [Chloroflexi bacterium]|nr:S8 family serine peptidase [Chloroflexota bacterium]
ILNDDGYGLLSWYICGLDWILAQRDPSDSSRPLFEAVNMSVTKSGRDDRNCGFSNNDPLHRAICRVVAGGTTVVAAAANDSHNASRNIPASYNEVITVSALADTDGKSGGTGGNACNSWGSYDKDDTFANFSNYGKDVDIMAPGKCILSTISTSSGYATLSGTSMAAPTVAGAVALYKASRPNATPAEVRESLRYLGNLNWKVSTDPDAYHEPLLDVARIGTLGTFALTPGASAARIEGAATINVPLTVVRSSTFFERVKLSITSVPSGWSATLGTSSLMSWSANSTSVRVVVPAGASPGSYDIGVRGTNQGRTVNAALRVDVVDDQPTARVPAMSLKSGVQLGTSTLQVRVTWDAATDPTSSITGYEVQVSKSGGSWGSTIARTASQRVASYTLALDATYRFRVRAVDTVGNWSPWAESASSRIHPVDDRNSSVVRSGKWVRKSSAGAYHGTVTASRNAKVSLAMTFTGTGIAVVGPRSSRRGKARVYIDGTYIETIRMRSSTSINRLVVFENAFSSPGTHTIVLRPTGTGTYPQFRLDAFVVLK